MPTRYNFAGLNWPGQHTPRAARRLGIQMMMISAGVIITYVGMKTNLGASVSRQSFTGTAAALGLALWMMQDLVHLVHLRGSARLPPAHLG